MNNLELARDAVSAHGRDPTKYGETLQPNSHKAYLGQLERFVLPHGDGPITIEVCKNRIRTILESRAKSSSNINQAIVSLTILLEYMACSKIGSITQNDLQAWKIWKKKYQYWRSVSPSRRALTPAELRSLFNALASPRYGTRQGERDILIFAIVLFFGRISEALALNLGDAQHCKSDSFSGFVFHAGKTKNHQDDEKLIPPGALAGDIDIYSTMKSYHSWRTDQTEYGVAATDPFFITHRGPTIGKRISIDLAQRIFANAVKQAKLPPFITSHYLRHTAGEITDRTFPRDPQARMSVFQHQSQRANEVYTNHFDRDTQRRQRCQVITAISEYSK